MSLTPSFSQSLKRSAKQNIQSFDVTIANQGGDYGYCLDYGSVNNRQWGDVSLLDCFVLSTSNQLEIRSINDVRIFGLETIYLFIDGNYISSLSWDGLSYKTILTTVDASNFRNETGNTIQIKLKGQI